MFAFWLNQNKLVATSQNKQFQVKYVFVLIEPKQAFPTSHSEQLPVKHVFVLIETKQTLQKESNLLCISQIL